MNEPKTFASLEPTLLARKGAAKPAMRPQITPLGGMTGAAAAQNLEDLGWNDMGENAEEEVRKGEILSLTPASADDFDEDDGEDYGTEESEEFEEFEEESSFSWQNFDDEEPEEEEDDTGYELPAASEPEVIRQRQQIEQTFTSPKVETIQAVRPTQPRRPSADQGRRAAFTLRLDEDRHIKLRLASTMRNRSAQQLVTEALDRFLAELPELDTLAAHLKRG